MPYKNPEHKRQWEREHREERNARRRTRSLPVVLEGPREALMPDLITERKADNATMIAALVAGMFVLALLFAAWRLGREVSEPSVHAQGVP
jgi:ferric-dicitrate binding protein FerR (iron transport regulator)